MTPDVNSKSGCAFASSQNERTSRAAQFSALVLLGAVLLRRRR
jgi:MYXO-CTERM domain-containing protein